MKHPGILAHSTEGASLCFLAFCREGVRALGSHIYPDITLDYIAFGHSMPAWEAGDHDSVRATLPVSADRLAGTDARIAGFGHGEAVTSDAAQRLAHCADPLG